MLCRTKMMNMQLNKAFYLYLTFVAILWAIIWWCLLINMHQYFSAVFYVLTGYYFINKILMKISPYSSKILFTVLWPIAYPVLFLILLFKRWDTVNAPDERAIAQSLHPNEQLKFNVEGADWYAYSENYGTSEEKLFVKFISTQIDALKRQYKDAEIYLIRNELDYWLFSPVDGRRFSPDYMLIVNDTVNQEMYYQCLIEPKGGHLLVNDEWKEEVLISLSDESSVIFDPVEEDDEGYKSFLKEVESMGYKEIKCLGFKFFNSDPRGETDFALDFRATLPH